MNYDYHFSSDNENQSNGAMPPVDMTPPAGKKGHGQAIAALVLGIISIISALLPLLSFVGFLGAIGLSCCCTGPITAIVGLILAIVSRVKAGKMEKIALIGLILCIVTRVIFVILTVAYFYIIMEVTTNPDGETAQWFEDLYYKWTGVSLREMIEEAQREAGTGK